jgi:hypothetical protein
VDKERESRAGRPPTPYVFRRRVPGHLEQVRSLCKRPVPVLSVHLPLTHQPHSTGDEDEV